MEKEPGKGSIIKRIIWGKPIRTQLFGVYGIAMVLPIVLLGIVLITSTYHLLMNYHTDLMTSDNTRVKNLMFEYTTQTINLSDSIVDAKPIQDLLLAEHESAAQFQRDVNRILLLDGYRSSHVEINDIEIYSDNPDISNYKQYRKVTEEIENAEWYQKACNQSGAFWISMVKKSTSGIPSYHLCLVRRFNMVDSDYNAVLVLWMNSDYLRSSIEISSFNTYIAVGDGNAFYTSDRSLAGKPMPMEIDYDMKYYQAMDKIVLGDKVCFAQVSTLNAYQSESKLYICTVNKQGYYEIWHILMISFSILGLSIVLPGILLFFFTQYFTRRIELLRDEMHKASRQDYELVPVLHGQDEISEAYEDLQLMVENIKKNEATVYEAQIKEQEIVSRQREMEYKMLASQINPHFLYNTLETIRMKAFTAGDREVAGAIKLLGKSMRYVLENTGTVETTLARELEHVEVYLNIQQLRFGDRFSFSVQVQEGIDTEEIYLLPLMLQPVVENSVVHGLENLEQDGLIQIRISRQEQDGENGGSVIMIDVWDNGGGMDEDTLALLRETIDTKDMSRSKSIGLYNINQRMKMKYGLPRPLRIDVCEDGGTRVRLILPVDICIHS